LAFSVERALRG